MRVVVIEGSDGSGKTRTADRVAKRLCDEGVPARAFHHRVESDDPVIRVLDWMRQRREVTRHAGEAWAPDVLVTDRWWLSTLVEAQHHATEGRALASLARAEASSVWLPPVAFWAILDAPDSVLDERLLARRETVTAADHARRAAYRRSAVLLADVGRGDDRMRRFDTTDAHEVVTKQIVEAVREALAASVTPALLAEVSPAPDRAEEP